MEAMKIDTILIPVDGSETSKRAAGQAVQMAKLHESKLILVHVRGRIPDFIGEPYFQHILDKMLDEAESVLAGYKEFISSEGVEFEERIMEGDPATAICTVAEVEKADMIVMGSRGLTDLAGTFLGSVSHKVLHQSACMVLMVR